MRTLHGWCVLLVLAATAVAHADGPAVDKSVEADKKFEEAQKLRDAGKVKEACDTFRTALSLNPNAIGTILNIARCAEEEGKTGSAVRWFTEARDRAKEQNLDPQLQAAQKHLDTLVPHVPHLAIAFAEAPPADAKILVDDRYIDKDAAGDIVVDPTTVKVVVSAPGRVSFVSTVAFDPKGDHEHKAISVPKLGYPVTVKNTRRTVGKVMTFGGLAIAAASVGVGLIAKHNYNNAIKMCSMTNGMTICDKGPYTDAKNAQLTGDIGTGVGIGGLALAAAGAALWFLTPTRTEQPVAVIPMIDSSQAGLAAVGRF